MIERELAGPCRRLPDRMGGNLGERESVSLSPRRGRGGNVSFSPPLVPSHLAGSKSGKLSHPLVPVGVDQQVLGGQRLWVARKRSGESAIVSSFGSPLGSRGGG